MYCLHSSCAVTASSTVKSSLPNSCTATTLRLASYTVSHGTCDPANEASHIFYAVQIVFCAKHDFRLGPVGDLLSCARDLVCSISVQQGEELLALHVPDYRLCLS